jgi:hypothetical protein
MRNSTLRHIVALAVLIASALPAYSQQPTMQFLSAMQARAALTQGVERNYYERLQLDEMRAKTGLALENLTLDQARSQVREAYGASTEDFTAEEQAALREALEYLQPVLQAKAPLYARTAWSFIKVAANIEGGLPHTRGDSIVLSDKVLASIAHRHATQKFDQPSLVWMLLVHEQTHVLERHSPALFAPLYTDAFGFQRGDLPAPPDWLRLHRVINPDAPDVRWIFPLDASPTNAGSRRWVLPDIVLLNDEHPRMPQDFNVVAVPVRNVAGHWTFADQTQPERLQPLAGLDVYARAFPEHSETFHPNEIAAVMLSELILSWHVEEPEHELWSKVRSWADSALR